MKCGLDNYEDKNDDNDKKTIDGNNHLIAGELTGEMCGERKWECAEEWFEFDEPGLHKSFSVAIIVVIIIRVCAIEGKVNLTFLVSSPALVGLPPVVAHL